jgi:hypothetical protein
MGDQAMDFANGEVLEYGNYYGLNMKCPSQAHVSPAGGDILGGARLFSRWN